MSTKFTPYSQQYKEACFQAWYSSGRPTQVKVLEEILPEDEYGRKPNIDVIRLWRKEDNWDSRADMLDEKVSKKMDTFLVDQKVEMLKQQARRARIIQEKGLEYLEENGFDSSSSAVAAIIKGAELERISFGISDTILKLSKLSDEELLDETQKLLSKFLESGSNVIDLGEIITDDNE
jgi:hypothetical protein